MNTKVEVSPRTIIFLIAILIGGWLIYLIRDILLLMFVSFILMSALNPLVDRLEKNRIPRALVILGIYIVGILLIALIGTSIVPLLYSESVYLIGRLPDFVNSLIPSLQLNLDTIIESYITNLTDEYEDPSSAYEEEISLTDKEIELLKMLYTRDMDAETATVVLHVSKIEFEHIVRKLLQNELLHYVSFNEIELTEEGVTFLSEKENEKKRS